MIGCFGDRCGADSQSYVSEGPVEARCLPRKKKGVFFYHCLFGTSTCHIHRFSEEDIISRALYERHVEKTPTPRAGCVLFIFVLQRLAGCPCGCPPLRRSLCRQLEYFPRAATQKPANACVWTCSALRLLLLLLLLTLRLLLLVLLVLLLTLPPSGTPPIEQCGAQFIRALFRRSHFL